MKVRVLLPLSVLLAVACSSHADLSDPLDLDDAGRGGEAGSDASAPDTGAGSCEGRLSTPCSDGVCECSGRGTCNEGGMCSCDLGYAGSHCEQCDSGFHLGEDGRSCTNAFCDPNPCGAGQLCNESSRVCCPEASCIANQSSCSEGGLRLCLGLGGACGTWGEQTSCGAAGCADDTFCASGVAGLRIEQWGTPLEDGLYGVSAAGTGADCLGTGNVSGALGGQPHRGRTDLFLTGGAPVRWTRSWGTADSEGGRAVAVAADGSLLVAGVTRGTLGPMQFGGLDIVLSRWRSDLTLSHTVQWGTEDRDEPRAMARDAQGNTYVTGWTYGAFQGANAGDTDVFLTKLNADDEIVWTLQWGGPGTDGGHGLAVDQDGNVYVVGTTGAENGARDAFCRKIDGEGSEVWTATWGGPNSDTATGVGLLSDGSLVVVGRTGGALGGSGSGAAFLARVDSAGNVSDLEQFGATRLDRANRVVVGQGDTYYIVGETEGEMVPGAHAGATDVFIQKRNADGSVQFTHQFGTPAAERADDAALAADGTLCIGGFTLGSFPGYSNAGSWDGYLARFAE